MTDWTDDRDSRRHVNNLRFAERACSSFVAAKSMHVARVLLALDFIAMRASTNGQHRPQIDALGFRTDIYVEVTFRVPVSADRMWTLRMQ